MLHNVINQTACQKQAEWHFFAFIVEQAAEHEATCYFVRHFLFNICRNCILTCKGHQSNLPHIITQTMNIKVPVHSKMCLVIESFSATTLNLNLSRICDITTRFEANCLIHLVFGSGFLEEVDILELNLTG